MISKAEIIDKIDEPLARPIKKNREKTQFRNIWNGRGNSTDPTDNKCVCIYDIVNNYMSIKVLI